MNMTGNYDDVRYGRWLIHWYEPPIPYRGCDFHFVHDDYDGGDIEYGTPSNDPRSGHAASVEEAKALIDEIEATLVDDRKVAKIIENLRRAPLLPYEKFNAQSGSWMSLEDEAGQ
jgi:hypothetical protein